MATSVKAKKGAGTAEKPINIITNKITIRSNDRSTKDVKTWRTGLKHAEAVENPNAKKLYDVYEEIMLDGHLHGIINKRIDSVLNKNLLFKVGEKPVPEMAKLINSKVFRDIVTEIMLSKMWGLSGLEFIPGTKMKFVRIPRKHIKPKWKVIAINESDQTGIEYEPLTNVWVILDNEPFGILVKCAFYALLKKGNFTDWAQYVELFGSPVMIAKYDAGDTQTEIELDKMLDDVSNSMRVKIPRQADFDMKDGKSSNGNGELQDKFRQALNQEMSIIVLGNTETTNSSKSSGYAQSKTHAQQQLEITKSDMLDVLDLLNSDFFFDILRSYGYPVDGGNFEYDKEIDINYLTAKIAIDKVAIKELGLPASKKSLYETYAIDQPGKEEDTLNPPPGKDTGTTEPGTDVEDLSDTSKPLKTPLKAVTPEDVQELIKKGLADFFA